MRSLPMLASVAAGLALSLACSYSYCPYGVFPFEGSTNVDPDVVITFEGFESLNHLPDLDASITLQTADGEPVDIDVYTAGGLVYVAPREPLAANTVFSVFGLSAPDASEHWWFDLPNDSAEVRFSTGGQPKLLSIADTYDDSILLGFSEVVDVDSLRGQLLFEGFADYRVAPYPGSDTLVEVFFEDEPTTLRGLGQGVVTPDGRTVAAPEISYVDLDSLINRHDARPSCGDYL